MEYKYLSEDELKQLIAATECTGMLQAPKRVQTAVWSNIAQQETTAKQAYISDGAVSSKRNTISLEAAADREEAHSAGSWKRRKQAQLAVYSLKVGLAAAAAIFMLLHLGSLQESDWLLHMPEANEGMAEENPWEKENEDFLHEKWTEVSEWFGTIFEPEEDRN